MRKDSRSIGQIAYDDFVAKNMADPGFVRLYREEAPKLDLWLALNDARHAAGFTQAEVASRLGVSQAQVARIEKRGYESYSLNTLRRYLAALGEGFYLEVVVHTPEALPQQPSSDRDEPPAAPRRSRSRSRRAAVLAGEATSR